ncbi:MAG: nucleotide sugar dehydrogenase [Nitrososphaerales archaeon]
MNSRTRIGVVGLGYAGLPMAVAIASHGVFKVQGVDLQRRIASLKHTEPQISEPGVSELFNPCLKKGNLRLSSEPSALGDCKIIFVSIDTPPKSDGSIDLRPLSIAAQSIGKQLKRTNKRTTVVLRSTVVPGTTRSMFGPTLVEASGGDIGDRFDVVVNPDFSAEGKALHDIAHPDRIVVGTKDGEPSAALRSFYHEFYGEGYSKIPYVETRYENAELTKYASNLFLSLKVGFANEISRICEVTPHADIDVVAYATGLDKRIGADFLGAGPGWGGGCFGKDASAILRYAEALGISNLPICNSSLVSNSLQKKHVVGLAESALGDLGERRVAVLGLAFKKGVSDVRGSQAFEIISELLSKGAIIRAYDPLATSKFKSEFDLPLFYAGSASQCVEGAEAVIILTDSDEFKTLDFFSHKESPIVIDTRRILTDRLRKTHIGYRGLGVHAAEVQ